MSGNDLLYTDLLERIARREEDAFLILHERVKNVLGTQIRKIITDTTKSEEVLQDVFLYIWLRAEAYRHDRGCPLAWMYTLARSRALDRWRRDQRERMTSGLDDEVYPLPNDEVLRRPSEVWQHALVRRGVGELPPAQQQVLNMAYFNGYTHSEIAESIGIPLGTVKARLRRALESLRGKLESKAGDSDRQSLRPAA